MRNPAMKPVKKSARERLVERFRIARPHMADAGERAAFLRDLREHERELFQRTVKAWAAAEHKGHMAMYDAIEAAILGTRGKRGAK